MRFNPQTGEEAEATIVRAAQRKREKGRKTSARKKRNIWVSPKWSHIVLLFTSWCFLCGALHSGKLNLIYYKLTRSKEEHETTFTPYCLSAPLHQHLTGMLAPWKPRKPHHHHNSTPSVQHIIFLVDGEICEPWKCHYSDIFRNIFYFLPRPRSLFIISLKWQKQRKGCWRRKENIKWHLVAKENCI